MGTFVCEYDFTSCHMSQDEKNIEAFAYIKEYYPNHKILIPIDEECYLNITRNATVDDMVKADSYSSKYHPNLFVYERLKVCFTIFNPGLNAERWAYFKF